jgi:hypothetical protein
VVGIHPARRPARAGDGRRVVGALHAPVLALWAVGFLGVLRLIEDYVSDPP